jgi:hypothetical protein
MSVTITQFRKDIFELTNQALEGKEVSFTYKGRRVKLVPENPETPAKEEQGHWLDRLTPMQIYNPDWVEPAVSYQEEIQQEWEKNWADFFDRLS